MKKLIALLAACCMILSCLPVFAASDRQIFDIKSLGIMQGDENGEMHLEDEITRAEFAQTVLNLIHMPVSQIGSMEGKFSDVPNDAWYAPAVNYIAALGYISGDPEGTFRPEDPVLVQEAMKILVNVLGYDVMAQENGGYPRGYIAAAARLQISHGMNRSGEEPALRDDILCMLYQSLDVELLQKQYTDADEPSYKVTGETLRDRLTRDADLYQVRGIVTADNSTWLIEPNSSFNPGEIEIGGRIYLAEGIDTAQYMGQEVECFYYDNEQTGKRVLKSIAPTVNNTVVEFDTEMFQSCQSGTLYYYPEENGKAKRLNLSDGCQFVYNNRLLTEFSDEIMELEEGSCRLVDNNGDNRFDYLFIEREQAVVVESVFETGEIYFKNTFTVDGMRYVMIEPDETQTYQIIDGTGKQLKITDIKPDTVLTVMRSLDGSYTKLVLSEDVREVTLSQLRGDEVLIEDTWHKIINPNMELQVGETVKGYFDYRGKLVYISDPAEFASGEKFGYIVKTAEDGGFGNIKVLMLTAGTVDNREEENKENLDDKNKISTLYCQNESVREMYISGRVRFNGETVSRAELVNKLTGPVIYQADSEGTIRSLESPELVGGVAGQAIQYSAKEMVFGGNEIYGGFGIDENTKVCCVPEEKDASMEDYLVDVKIDNRDSAQKFNAQGYVLDQVTNNVKFLVLTRPMDTDTVTSISYSSSNLGVVTDIATTLDEENSGETYQQITILSKSGTQVYDAKNLNSNNQILSTFRKGDMIYYELDHNGNLLNARLIVSIPEISVSGHWSEATENESLYGLVTSLELGVIDVVRTRRADHMYIQTDNNLEEIWVANRNAPVVFLYDEQREEYTVTTTANIREGVDRVYVLQPYGTPKALIIKR